MRLQWGKYAGWRIEGVPLGYLVWLLEEGRITEELRGAIRVEVARRLRLEACGAPDLPRELQPVAEDIVEAGFRQLARRHHPDVGGSGDAMLLLLDAREHLRRWLQRAAAPV